MKNYKMQKKTGVRKTRNPAEITNIEQFIYRLFSG